MIGIIDIFLAIIGVIGIISFLIFAAMGIANKFDMFGESDSSLFETNIYFRSSAIIALISFISLFSLSYYVSKLSRNEIIAKIENTNQSDLILYVNDTITKNDSLISALKKINKVSSQRNTGNTDINIKLKSKNDIIILTLLRDFNYKTKYWVFYLNHETTSKNCIGEINTESLNQY
jgi:hypothetical protein